MWRKILLLTSIFLIASFLIYKITSTINKKEKIQNTISVLPNFKFYTLSNLPFTNDSIIVKKSSLLLFFNTTCDHCLYETEQIIKNIAAFKNTNVLLISSQAKNEILLFNSTYNISNYSTLHLLHDSTDNFYKTFGTNAVPTAIIYNASNELVKKIHGEVKIETIISLLQ
jgi:thiol-disulfide isomerase/thioredoxin